MRCLREWQLFFTCRMELVPLSFVLVQHCCLNFLPSFPANLAQQLHPPGRNGIKCSPIEPLARRVRSLVTPMRWVPLCTCRLYGSASCRHWNLKPSPPSMTALTSHRSPSGAVYPFLELQRTILKGNQITVRKLKPANKKRKGANKQKAKGKPANKTRKGTPQTKQINCTVSYSQEDHSHSNHSSAAHRTGWRIEPDAHESSPTRCRQAGPVS